MMKDPEEIKKDLARVGDLFRSLLYILENEGDDQVDYARNELRNNIRLIETVFGSAPNQADLNEILTEIKESYQRMYPPRGGLTEFFIWREDFDQRLRANQPLDRIKDELKVILKV